LLVAGEPGHGHTALALALGGRLATDAGSVELDGVRSGRRLRRGVALVDVPGVSEPDDVLPLRTVVAEELAMAGRPTRHGAVQAYLDERDAGHLAGHQLEAVPPDVRTAILTEIAAARPGVLALVLTVPDRFGGDPHTWWQLAGEFAAKGYAVVVTCTDASAYQLTTAEWAHPWTDPRPVALGSAGGGEAAGSEAAETETAVAEAAATETALDVEASS
jgi:hypothetical protein